MKPATGSLRAGLDAVQLRFATGLTSEEYVKQKGWLFATLERCPLHPEGGCGFALADLRLCASDPLCAEHAPSPEGGPRTLHGAACHACAFSPETSCERGNKYLDRSVVVDTISPKAISFFDAWPRRRE